ARGWRPPHRWERGRRARTPSSPGVGPRGALDQDLSVRRHARLGEADRSPEPELDADDLLHAVAPEVGVLGREGGLGIDPRDDGLDGGVGRRVEVAARRLTEPDPADLPLRDEATQVDLTEVHQRDDGRAGRHDLARLGGAGGDGAGEWRHDLEILA